MGWLLWLLIGGLAAAAILWQWHHPPLASVVTSAGTAARLPELPTVTSLESFRLPPLAQYEEMNARPLFIAGRRPEPPPPDEPPPPPPEKPPVGPEQKFLLLGVVLSPQTTVALLRLEEPNAKTARVKIGDTVGEWRLETIFPNRVTLRKGAEIREVALARPKKPSGSRRTGAKPPSAPPPSPANAPGDTPPPIPAPQP